MSSYEPELSDHSHALAFALTVEAARSIEERLFRHVHRVAPGILRAIALTGSQPILLAVENDERVVGADWHARAVLDIEDQQLAAGLSLWRFFYRLPSLFASKSGDGFAKLTRLGESAPWHVVFTPPLPPRAAPLDLRPRVRRFRDIPAASGGPALTARERAILELVAQGQSNKQIARTLGISPETVKNTPGTRLRQARRRASRAGHRAREGPRAPRATSLKSNRLRIPQSRSRSASGEGDIPLVRCTCRPSFAPSSGGRSRSVPGRRSDSIAALSAASTLPAAELAAENI